MISFFVAGIAKPAGSKRAFFNKGMKFPVVVDACKGSKDWKSDVKAEAIRFAPQNLLEGPLKVTFEFRVTRPKHHFRSNGTLKDAAFGLHPTTRPDVLKLSRGVEDALTGIIYKDDSQIVDEHLIKIYGDKPGVWITIEELQ